MSIENDRWIGEQYLQHGTIEPVSESQIGANVISNGLSSCGCDHGVSDKLKIIANANSAIIDRKAFEERLFVSGQGEADILSPNSFALARSIEYFRNPRDVLAICVGKSTYARCEIIVNVTPFEPEWEGISPLRYQTPLPNRPGSVPTKGCARYCFSVQKSRARSARLTARVNTETTGIVLPRL
jgi:dCTP deaminase